MIQISISLPKKFHEIFIRHMMLQQRGKSLSAKKRSFSKEMFHWYFVLCKFEERFVVLQRPIEKESKEIDFIFSNEEAEKIQAVANLYGAEPENIVFTLFALFTHNEGLFDYASYGYQKVNLEANEI